LKPGRRLRKLGKVIKRNVTLKRALIGGAIIGAAFIPGAAPAAMRLARGAGSVVRGGARLLGRGAGALFRHTTAPTAFGPQLTPEDAAARGNLGPAMAAAAAALLPGAAQPGPDMGPTGSSSPPPGPAMEAAAQSSGSGGGGGGPMPASSAPPDDGSDAGAPADTGPAAPSFAGMGVPVLIVAALAAATMRKPRRARRGSRV
jgi:hypothetical protein